MSSKELETNYNPWPLGHLPEEWQRSELSELQKRGYTWDDPREIIWMFEKKMADYTGAPYALAIDNCTDGIMLGLQWSLINGKIKQGDILTFPSRCYVSPPMVAKVNGFKIRFEDENWSGLYQIKPTNVWDSAVRFQRDMYIEGSIQVMSFQIKKRLPIGKGGIILTDSKEMYDWARMASFEGRDLNKDQWDEQYEVMGWNMYMTLDDAARGLLIMEDLEKKDWYEDSQNYTSYAPLDNQPIFKDDWSYDGYLNKLKNEK